MTNTFYMVVSVLAVCTAFIFAFQEEQLHRKHLVEVAGLKTIIKNTRYLADVRLGWVESCAAWRLENGQFTDKPPTEITK